MKKYAARHGCGSSHTSNHSGTISVFFSDTENERGDEKKSAMNKEQSKSEEKKKKKGPTTFERNERIDER